MRKDIFVPMILVLCMGVGLLFFLPYRRPLHKIPTPQVEIQTEGKHEPEQPEQPEMFDKKYQVLRMYDEGVSFRSIHKYTRKIKVNLGLSREELIANLIHAAWEMHKEKDAKAVKIFAYRPDDMERDLYTAGICTLAPFGRWAEATNTQYNSVSSLKPVVELAKVYFINVPPLLKAWSNVVINAPNTKLYRTRDMDPDYVITYLKQGQKAIIVGSIRGFSTDEFCDLYMIQITTKGKKNVAGWVFGDALNEVQDTPVTQPTTKKKTQKKRK
ncbi:MAG: hypothetical protein II832_05975 [Synergistaceae bacterium]|nr:hypothetical protein [Synergistaceae bacterium]